VKSTAASKLAVLPSLDPERGAAWPIRRLKSLNGQMLTDLEKIFHAKTQRNQKEKTLAVLCVLSFIFAPLRCIFFGSGLAGLG
jgi:hypothetical protein